MGNEYSASGGGLTSLPPVIDNGDDWRRMRDPKHKGDDIIKLCDPRNKVRFSHHFLCSFIFDQEIEALTDAHSEGSSESGKIRRHLQLLRVNSVYNSFFYPGEGQPFDWNPIEFFFASSITPSDEQGSPMY